MPNPITLPYPGNSIYIADPNGLPVLGQSPYGVYGIQPWMAQTSYQSKYTFTDQLLFLIHNQLNEDIPSGAALYLLDQYDPNTGNFHAYGASGYNTVSGSIDLNTAPYLKGYQAITGNNYVDPFTFAITPLITTMFSFSFSDLGISREGTYYLMVENAFETPSTQYQYTFSEPFLIKAAHRDTLLFQSTFNTNKSDNWNVVVTGWYNDYPTNTQTYTSIFLLRAEGYVIDFDPKSVQVSYLQQSYQALQTYSKMVRMKTLKVGELSTGIPPHMMEAISYQILSDTYWINGYSYINFNTSNSTALTDLWKSRRPNDAYPLLYASTMVMERFQSQGAIVTPPPPIPTGEYDPSEYSSSDYAT
jgi:hypothetical protein